MSAKNLPASVRAKLLNHSRATKRDFNFVLTRYAIERLLYRISISRHSGQFLLKGALLFDLWFDIPHRPTRDADFLGFGSSELSEIESVFKEVCAIEAPDGMVFQPGTVRASEIRKEANYRGVRVTLVGLLASARCQVQVDIGFGDAVTPGPEDVEYPVILAGSEPPRLRAYPRYTVIAEKIEALVTLGIANSRMKDFFDLWVLGRYSDFDGSLLSQAVRATFDSRRSTIPAVLPMGLSSVFANDPQKQTQWKAFLNRNGLDQVPLDEVVNFLVGFLMPIIQAAAEGEQFPKQWPAGGPWSANRSS